MLFALLLVMHFCTAAVLMYGLGQLAYRPWRRVQDAHWTERARLIWPARISINLWIYSLPFFQAAAQSYFFPEIPAIDLLAALAAFPGELVGIWPQARAALPQLRFFPWMGQWAVGVAQKSFRWSILVAAGVAMPWHFGWGTLAITAAVAAITGWFAYGGLVPLFRALRLLVPAPERLVAIARATAERMQMPPPTVLLQPHPSAGAFAAPTIHTLIFTDSTLAIFSDEELGTVCAHELAHLSEPPAVFRVRVLSAFLRVPFILIKPVVAAAGIPGIVILFILLYLSGIAVRNVGHRMEKRADSMAKQHEGENDGVYARALERLYQYNQVPAVIGGRRTHPDLYDRLLAAGITPDYPRPAAPESPFNTYLLLGTLAAITFFIAINRIDDEQEIRRDYPPDTQGVDGSASAGR